jgi:signal transduction histidine kinase
MIRSSVMNLVLNAFDACGRRGDVEIRAERKDGLVRIMVSDNGPGPPAAIRERLGEPFVTGKPEGIGLGLMLARQAAASQNGQLTWDRIDNRTYFRLEWPEHGPRVCGKMDSSANARLAHANMTASRIQPANECHTS